MATVNQASKIRARVTDEEDQRGETDEEITKKQDVIFSSIGQSCNLTIKARDVLKYGPHFWLPGMQVHYW